MISAAPLLNARGTEAPAAPVSIAKCASYDEDFTAKLATMFDQLGGLDKAGAQQDRHRQDQHDRQPGHRFQGLAPAIDALHASQSCWAPLPT